MRIKPMSRALAFLIGTGACAASVHAADWLQFGYDQASSSNNKTEPGYSTASGNKVVYHAAIKTADSTPLQAPADSTAIYLSNVVTGAGTKDLLFVVSLNGTLVALDASNGSSVWSKHPSGSRITTGAPTVDPSLQFVYAYGVDGKVHKYGVGDGSETITCDPNTPANLNCWPEVSTIKTSVEKGASGLAIASTTGGIDYLYSVITGYVGDGGDYQGHVTTINLGSGVQNVFNSQCSNIFAHMPNNGTPRGNDCNLGTSTNPGGPGGRDGQESGIWGRPGAIYDASMNRIYIATGNGLFDADTAGGFEWGDSVLALKSDGTGLGGGLPMDSYTPSNHASLDASDTDVGSTSPAILPSTSNKYPHLAVQSGKDRCVRLINLADMSGHGGPGHAGTVAVPSELNGATSCSSDAVDGQVRTQPAVWVNPADGTTWFFIATDNSIWGFHLVVDGATGNVSLTNWHSTNGTGGTSPIVANGTVYYVSNHSSAPNTVRALQPTSGTVIWSDSSIGAIKWQSPIVINGHLYLIDQNVGGDNPASSQLWVYALDGIFKNGFQ